MDLISDCESFTAIMYTSSIKNRENPHLRLIPQKQRESRLIPIFPKSPRWSTYIDTFKAVLFVFNM